MLYFTDEPIARSRRLLFAASFCFGLLLFFPSLVAGQSGGGLDQTGTGGQDTIQGRIYFPSGRRSDVQIMVKLQNHSSGELSVMSDSNGWYCQLNFMKKQNEQLRQDEIHFLTFG